MASAPGDVPVLVKANALLPLAEPVRHVAPATVFDLTVQVYGNAPAPFVLLEDKGESFAFERGAASGVALAWADGQGTVTREGDYAGQRYRVQAWQQIDAIRP